MQLSTTMAATVRRAAATRARILMPLLAALLLGGAGLALSTTSASAATTTVAAGNVFSPQGITPDTNYVIVHYADGASYDHPCNGGAVYPINAKLTEVVSQCSVRVWVFENAVGTTPNRCISPRGIAQFDGSTVWANLQVTNNTSPCPN